MSEKRTCPVCDLHHSTIHREGYCPNAFNKDGSPRTAVQHYQARASLQRFFGTDTVPPLNNPNLAIEEYEREFHKHGLMLDEVIGTGR